MIHKTRLNKIVDFSSPARQADPNCLDLKAWPLTSGLAPDIWLGTEFSCEWTSKALADVRIDEDARAKILHRNATAMLSQLAKVAQRDTVAA